MVVGLVVLAILFLTTDALTLATSLLDQSVIGVVAVIEVLFLGWRLLAVVSSMVDRSFPRFRLADAVGLAVIVALVTVPQAGVLAVTVAAQQAEAQVFDPEAFPSAEPEPTDTPALLSPGESPFPSESLSPSGTPLTPRVTVLLIGVDSGVGRNTALTDTMIVASLDPVGKTVSMVSIPRDMVDAPLPKGGKFSAKINGLVAYVRWHPDAVPGLQRPRPGGPRRRARQDARRPHRLLRPGRPGRLRPVGQRRRRDRRQRRPRDVRPGLRRVRLPERRPLASAPAVTT